MNRRRPGLFLVSFLLTAVSLAGSTPNDERWEQFITGHTGAGSIAEDAKMGLLVDFRNPEPEWEEAIGVCESIFSALENATLPSDSFYPANRTILAFAFEKVLSAGPQEFDRRYGRPEREGRRITVPVRITGRDEPVYGHIYMIRSDDLWYVEQWSLDLTGRPIGKEIQ